MQNDIANKLLIVLVVYQQNYFDTIAYKSLGYNIRKLDPSNAGRFGIFIYDNSPNKYNETSSIPGLTQTYYHNPENPGVSTAYNAGYYYAKNTEYNWLILADQDTEFSAAGLEEYLKSISVFPDVLIHSPILRIDNQIISPSKYKFRRGFPLKAVEPGKQNLGDIVPLNSGMCINLRVFERIAIYNEKIRLDFSDFDFIRRITPQVKYFVVMPVAFNHSLSSYSETYDSALNRFKYYCDGAYHSIITVTDFFLFGLVTFMRGIKLCYKFRRLKFLKVFYNSYVLKKKFNEI
ncbi:glycosyltransferase family protein [Mucilaginibacter xinganensis]|uniref:Glycosyltransferase 2-like prokaryotic type domain-containing protein n=1 Tax=Mucilaginibacter xinganensis TaxID=1234841 RepID=A0A223NVT3_9SPHI|nr:hypothetical protein [Mucilaginibacter xinganensis]ASU33651.1 hypothetical protein MuYL_1755 [Mucilaginibacter xinganensis]